MLHDFLMVDNKLQSYAFVLNVKIKRVKFGRVRRNYYLCNVYFHCNRFMGMKEFKPTDQLYLILDYDYRLMQVMSRFGITMGFADKTISEVCHQHGVDVHTFLAVTNIVINYSDITSHKIPLDLVSVNSLLSYLKRTHQHLLNFKLPQARKKLFSAMDCSLENEVAFLLVKYFDLYVAEIRSHMTNEEKELYAYAERLLEGSWVEHVRNIIHKHREGFVAKLHELIKMFLQYYPQVGTNEELNDVVYDLYRIEEDLDIHCYIEDWVLLPLVRRLEARRMKQPKPSPIQQSEMENDLMSQQLSDREQAIAVCVAKGMANKEIANELDISVHTVTTHRRNIARKLNIHSPAGIAIYCVVNKLVKLENINV